MVRAPWFRLMNASTRGHSTIRTVFAAGLLVAGAGTARGQPSPIRLPGTIAATACAVGSGGCGVTVTGLIDRQVDTAFAATRPVIVES